jgi:sulfate/thiosulfate transport system permease protein
MGTTDNRTRGRAPARVSAGKLGRAFARLLPRASGSRRGMTEPRPIRWLLIALALGFLGCFLVLPLVLVFAKAFSEGLHPYFAAVSDPITVAAIRLTLLTALFSVPATVVFGLAAAWAITKFEFPGKNLLVTLIDLPFSVSPVISGMMFVLLFGARGLMGPWLIEHNIRIIFALPGIVLATTFVISPLVARELIPLMRSQGSEEEQAAVTMGASGLQTFLRVSLPKMKWGLFYGIILCTARAVGEFGAVSVVSGHIRGKTTTVPLHVEMLYNEYQLAAAFAVASLLTILALVTLVLKGFIEWRLTRTGVRD